MRVILANDVLIMMLHTKLVILARIVRPPNSDGVVREEDVTVRTVILGHGGHSMVLAQ